MRKAQLAIVCAATFVAMFGVGYVAANGARPAKPVPACPAGSVGAWTWTREADGSCEAMTIVNGVAVAFVRNGEGQLLATWTYQGDCGAAGVGDAYFATVDC